VPSLAENGAGAARVREKLPAIQGVQSVRLNPATGSVLIVYRDGEVRPELLFAAVVRLMDLDAELKRTPPPIITRELREILGSVNRMVYDRTGGLVDLWSAGLILLAGIGIQRLFVQGMRAFPAGLTLVWWGLASLLGARQS
jgi:copper chaperone CopZ